MSSIINLYEECANAQHIAISGHIRPDGDCIGSCMAVAMYLRKRLPDAQVDVYLDPVSDVFECIPGTDSIMHV